MKNIKHTLLLLFFLLASSTIFAQSKFYTEVGGSAGAIAIMGDWLPKSDMTAPVSYTGFEANFIYNIQMRSRRWGIKTNIGIAHVFNVFNREGQADELLQLRGFTNIISLGAQLDYEFFEFGKYSRSRNMWTPYISGGFNLIYFSNENYHADGAFGNGGYSITTVGGMAPTFKGALGAKFRYNRYTTLFVEFTGQYAFDDTVDGLIGTGGANDMISSVNIGITYSFKSRR